MNEELILKLKQLHEIMSKGQMADYAWPIANAIDALQARAQLAAPAGVVLPSENAVMRVVLREMGGSRHIRGTSNWCADLGMAVLNEVRRLNAAAPSPAPKSGVYGTDPLACSGCVSGCFRCSAPASTDHSEDARHMVSDVVQMPRGLRPVIAMILNALDRDAAEGKQARGEMAAELRALLNGGRV